jgi:Spherulation-specific family 4
MNISWVLAISLIIGCSTSYAMLRTIESKHLDLQAIGNAKSQQANPSDLTQELVMDRSSNTSKLQILLPLYIYPNWYDRDKYIWKQVTVAARKVPIVAIINPNNGPNNAPPNPDYQQGLKDLHQAGVKIVGYVPTNYAKRDIQTVKADIEVYSKYFNIDGIFVDETANAQDKLNYYHQIYQYTKSRSPRYQVIINPGANIIESYLHEPVADVSVNFENYQKVWNDYHPPAYMKHYSPQHFAALVHTTADAQMMKSTIDLADKYKFGYIYITNDSTDTADRNPWDTLPTYWQAQVNYIQKINATK